MADDVWVGFLQGMVAFGQTRAARLVATSFKDTGAFLVSLVDGAGDDNTRTSLKTLKADIDALKPDVEEIAKAIKADVDKAAKSSVSCADELAKDPFTSANAAAGALYLGEIMAAFDSALLRVAEKAPRKEPSPKREAIEKAIAGITKPWKTPFIELGNAFTGDFDKAARQLFNIQNASTQLAGLLSFNRNALRLELKLVQVGPLHPPGFTSLTFDTTELVGFLSFKDKAIVGLTIRTNLKAGLRGDKMLAKVIPDGAPSTDATYTSVNLDTDKGLTFGDSKSKSIMLPVRFSYPAIELRELALMLPETGGKSGEVQLRATIAGKLGDVLGAVVEGGGIVFRAGGGNFTVGPRAPDAIGVRVKVPPFSGGGYIRRNEDFTEYRGALELQLGWIGISAHALVAVDPFSMVVVMSVTFRPKIELSFGFTLSGVGGLLALDRGVDTDEFRKGIHDGTASLILFPDDPIQAAPKILEKLAKVFPARPGAFAVGPLLQLGWGSQAGFVLAKLGLVIALPDPKLILLGAVQIGVPSAEIDEKKRIIDLRAEIYGEFDPEYLLLLVGLTRSKLAKIPITGDLGLFIRWAGTPTFALSVGGFHSRYAQKPPELADLRRIEIDLSPGGIDWLRITAKGFFALTANSLQFGGGVWLYAEVGPATGEAWLSIEALFIWTPRFYFEADFDAGLTAKVFTKTIAGVHFHGRITGTNPFSVHGTAKIELAFVPDIKFNVGPIEWGEKDTSVAVTLNPRQVVVEALKRPTSWTAELPPRADLMVRLAGSGDAVILAHPLGVLNVRQEQVPLDTHIDRIGQNPASPDLVKVVPASAGAGGQAFVSVIKAPMPPGHFINLPKDQQVTIPDFNDYPVGIKFASHDAPRHGTGLDTVYEWETCFPQETFGVFRDKVDLAGGLRAFALARNAVAVGAKARENPYQHPKPDHVAVPSTPMFEVRRQDDLSPSAASGALTASDAWQLRNDAALRGEPALEMVAVGALS
jgi:hypothetical protein